MTSVSELAFRDVAMRDWRKHSCTQSYLPGGHSLQSSHGSHTVQMPCKLSVFAHLFVRDETEVVPHLLERIRMCALDPLRMREDLQAYLSGHGLELQDLGGV